MTDTHKCKTCGAEKPQDKFQLYRTNGTSRRKRCTDCRSRDKFKSTRKLRGTYEHEVARSRSKAKSRRIVWTIEDEDTRAMWDASKTCPCCGREFSAHNTTKYSQNPAKKSFDRIHSDFGYVRGNVQVVCSQCNQAKNQFTQRDFEQHAVNVAAMLLPELADEIRSAYAATRKPRTIH